MNERITIKDIAERAGVSPGTVDRVITTVRMHGSIDNKTVLEREDNAATVNWGSQWRMPTAEEALELIENITCQHHMFTIFGRYWTLTLDEKRLDSAKSLQINANSKKQQISPIGRFIGQNVRAVSK